MIIHDAVDARQDSGNGGTPARINATFPPAIHQGRFGSERRGSRKMFCSSQTMATIAVSERAVRDISRIDGETGWLLHQSPEVGKTLATAQWRRKTFWDDG